MTERKVALDVDPELPEHDLATLETTIKYAGYLEQESSRAERARRDDRRRIAPQFPFESVPGFLERWFSGCSKSGLRHWVRRRAFQG